MPATRLSTFDDWVDLFRVWQRDIGVAYPEITDYKFEAKFGPTRSNEIEFGAYKGRPKWEKVMHIPDQRMRDALLNLIVYQDRKSTRLNSSHLVISYAVFCLKK